MLSKTKYHSEEDKDFIGKVYKIRHDDKGTSFTVPWYEAEKHMHTIN